MPVFGDPFDFSLTPPYFALMVADATFQSGPPAIMASTIFNVESFFGWVSTAEEVTRALNQTVAVA